MVAEDKLAALGVLKGWFIVPVIYFYLIVNYADRRTIDRLIIALAVNGWLVALLAILQWLNILPLLWYQRGFQSSFDQYLNQGRAFSVFESPNYLAMYLVPIILVVVGWWRGKIASLCAWLILPIISVYLSGSRAGILSLILGLLVFCSLRSRKARTACLPAIIAIVSLGVYVITHIKQFDVGRWYIWQGAWYLLREHPLTGIGPAQFESRVTGLFGQDEFFRQYIQSYAIHPHNFFFSFWLSGGVLAVIGLVWLLIGLAVSIFRQRLRSDATIAGSIAAIISVLCHGIFDSSYFKGDLAIIFWMLISLMAVGDNHAKSIRSTSHGNRS